MKKRSIGILVLALILALMLPGCGTADKSSSGDSASTAEIEDQATPQAAGAEDAVKILDYRVSKDYQSQWDDHYNMQTVECAYDGIVLGDEDRKALNGLDSSLRAFNEQVKKESGYKDMKVVATGGLGRIISEETDKVQIYDSSLTLEGLRLIYERNKR